MSSMNGMNGTDMLTAYQNISDVTGEMAAAARAGEWDRLATLERWCAALVARLEMAQVGAAQPVRLTSDILQRKVELIHKILADDAEIRGHTEPWMGRVQYLLGNAGMERRLRRAYGSGIGDGAGV
ncbi:MAG: flagellar protein FliT [Salinisphaera sp.]|nr:flagellar protein FliT [Salinisphaera sp.]